MITQVLCLLLAVWQESPLPTGMTLDKDEQILKKYGVYKPPIPLPPLLSSENVAMFYKTAEQQRPRFVDIMGNALFEIPELVFDGVLLTLRTVTNQEDDTITSKVLSIDPSGTSGHLFPEFMSFFAQQETKFFSGFGDSYLITPDVERGVADIDFNDFMIEQRKVMWDVLKKTYFSKYKFRAEERLHDDAFYINQWRGLDFIALPPFMGAYLYYRGLDKSFGLLGTQVHILIEPGMRFVSNGDVIGAMAIEWKPTKTFPFGIISSMGMYSHKPEFEFIGIGTSIGEVKKAISASQPR